MKPKNTQKTGLILAVQELLKKNNISTQEEIKLALQKQGYDVNQVKVSRILHKLGAVKMNEAGSVVYRLPVELLSVSPERQLREIILNISHNEVMVTIQTAPGCAQFVACFLDQAKDAGILATVAGDNTIFIAPQSIKQTKKLHKTIYQLLLGS